MGEKQEIYERIRKIRGTKTQGEFAASLGISQRAVCNYESQGRTPRGNILRRICEHYGISEAWLRTGEGPMRAQEGVTPEGGAGHFFAEDAATAMPPDNGPDLLVQTLRENADLLRQNGDLRVELERQARRIADLEARLAKTSDAALGTLETENRELRARLRELERAALVQTPATDILQPEPDARQEKKRQ